MIAKSASKIFRIIERVVCYGQGKGYGSATIADEVKFISDLLPSSPNTLIDIGGNEGNYSAELRKKYVGANIHIFEPSTKNCNLLFQRFKNDTLVKVNPCAVSDSSGKSVLYYDKPGSGLGSVNKRRLDHFGMKFDESQTIDTIRFEDYWRSVLLENWVDFVKIDIEGHELCALKGFGDCLPFVGVFQFEFGGANIDSRTYFQDLFYFFRNNCFKIYRMSPFGLVPIDQYGELDETFVTTNYVAVNQSGRK